MTLTERPTLHELARLHRIQLSYTDAEGRRRRAKDAALLAVLRALGAAVDDERDTGEALRARRRALYERGVEPVILAWGGIGEVLAWVPAGDRLRFTLRDDGVGASFEWEAEAPTETTAIDGRTFCSVRCEIPEVLPAGYYELVAECGEWLRRAVVISAPPRAHNPADSLARGVYVPLYAIHSHGSLGAGNLSDLQRLIELLAERGGNIVGILPILASFLDDPCEPSPYAPVSRRLWNEFFVDVTRVPEFSSVIGARDTLAPTASIEDLNSRPHVDYRRQAALQREVLTRLSSLLRKDSQRSVAHQEFLSERPVVHDYARFRGACARYGVGWRRWPASVQAGTLSDSDIDHGEVDYHAFVQWIAHEQLEEVAESARARDSSLYLDLPLGVHPDGYDAWRERQELVSGVSTGAPPDPFFTKGQNWGFAPLDPESSRLDGHRYFRECLEHHMRVADTLRIDHVMAFHRLFWIPEGMPASDGVYVRYPAEELYAVLSLESHRHGTQVIGENLGTVPENVNQSMRRHGLGRMAVLQYELGTDTRSLPEIQPGSLATLNTHDMPTFAAFWQSLDVDDRVDLGLLDERESDAERRRRALLVRALVRNLRDAGFLAETQVDVEDALIGALAYLGSSRATVALVNLEDLWLETLPQNTPGTLDERPNWVRRARLSLEEIAASPGIARRLEPLLNATDDGS